MGKGFAVDGVLCISLLERQDRRALLHAQLVGYFPETEFVLVERDRLDPQRGCFHSHQRCARILIERGWSRALILEDDVMFYEITVEHVKRINRYLERRDPPVFYLGLILGRLWPTWSKGIVGCRALGTHAYILNRAAASFVSAESYSSQGIDNVLKRRLPGRAAYPMLCQQQPEALGKSDLDDKRGARTVKCDAFWQRNYSRQFVEWRKNLLMLLTPMGWK